MHGVAASIEQAAKLVVYPINLSFPVYHPISVGVVYYTIVSIRLL